MGIPIVTVIVLIGRAGALPNAIDGIKLYMGVWYVFLPTLRSILWIFICSVHTCS